tara:strand:+ start:4901 stop:5695 length:795 start_codon:yes stop_codon:yes gene_type:complete
LNYDNYGPFKVPRRGQIIDRARLSEFWRQVEHKDPGLSTAQGCYVFAIKAGQGYTPWYVGKATGRDGFLQEALADGKQNQYNWVWTSHGYRRGSMVLFLIARRTQQGRGFSRQAVSTDADWLERHLISLALEANNELLNVRDTRFYRELFVPGVINDPARKVSPSTLDLQRTLNLRTAKRSLPRPASTPPPLIEAVDAGTSSPPNEPPPEPAEQAEPFPAVSDHLTLSEPEPEPSIEPSPVISPARQETEEPKPRLFLFGRRRT